MSDSSNQRTIVCGHLAEEHMVEWVRRHGYDALAEGGGVATEAGVLPLRLFGDGANVELRVRDIRDRLDASVPDRFVDLAEIATYVYCADQAVPRGGAGVEDMGLRWRRQLEFHVPVREPDFWSSDEVLAALRETLGFLSDDDYHFAFTPDPNPPRWQNYQMSIFGDAEPPGGRPEEVVLYSGGLDSLAGAVRECVVDRRKVALVMHRPTEKFKHRHRHLRQLLDGHAGPAFAPWHVPVAVNKAKGLSREYTQRSRSFLYAALAATVADVLGLDRIRFYENGVVSLNLPLSPQVVGAKATRTTHPRVLAGFRRLLSLVAGRKFGVDNPFVWHTKADVVRSIADAGCADTIGWSTSCTHTWEMTNEHPHCGTCSQCVDRRFAVLAAGRAGDDPAAGYKVDLETGPQSAGEHRTMLAAYVDTATRVAGMDELAFFSRYGEAARVLRYMGGTADAVASRVFGLYQKHARDVCRAVDEAVARHTAAIRNLALPDTCLVRLVCDGSGSAVPVPSPTTTTAPAAAENIFLKKGGGWLVGYAGHADFVVVPGPGAAYLHALLSSPGRSHSAVDLVFDVAKAPARYALGNAGPKADEEARRAYAAKFKDLEEELADARETGNVGRQEELLRDMSFLAEQIEERGWGGRAKNEHDDREKVRKSFFAAYTRALAQIREEDPSLADHLKASITCGMNPVYAPAESVTWET